MDASQPRFGGPTRRRSFTPAQKLDHVAAYEAALTQGGGGAYLRQEGLYSSQITEWRRLRDAGVLAGKSAGAKIGRPTAEQAEIARLRRQLDLAQRRLSRTEAALSIMGKTHALLEENIQERAGSARAQEALMATYRDLRAAGITTRAAAALTGLSRATAARKPVTPLRATRVVPANRLSPVERKRVVATLDSARFVDQPPLQVYAQLLDEDTYLCSVSSMYRILGEHHQVRERRRLARHPARVRPELVATAPGQVYSWDITKLAGPVKGKYFDAYVMIDIYSRYIVGAVVHAHESGPLAVEMMKEIFGIHGIPQVVHADRGTSMTSKTVAALLSDLEVTRSHSRPKVSNDNPYSEAWFKTLKYAPTFPERFGCLADARGFLADFVQWYNHEHRHSGIGLHSPADVHYGLAAAKATDRLATLTVARAANPERFSNSNPPKILELPDSAWINPPLPVQPAA
ncbi:MAG TPA: IS3 family transposase [Dermatophilaceae bacterium]|nr:IS3 family transposase [Dermatophilaceae bacterium]